MSKKPPIPTSPPKERAFLVGVEIYGHASQLSLEDSLSELALLGETAGLLVVGQATQKIDRPHPQTFIGSGKVEEIKALVEETQANVILFDDELSPRHLRELEDKFGEDVRILDRTALILDIFALHAHTREGALQVELAQYEYRLPRLTRAWTHLARQAGGGAGRTGGVGGVGLRGPGETQLEVDRRDINRRISQLKSEIEKVRVHRKLYRSRRRRSHIPQISLVGYTNAGKSTLLNRLSSSNVLVADQLFATLDPTTRRIELAGGHPALLTDTVGFIQKLPTELVAAFQATLEEIAESDLLLHVIDINHPNAAEQAQTVFATLEEIDAEHIPVVSVLNKIDALDNSSQRQIRLNDYPNATAISALKGDGIGSLLALINDVLYETFVEVTVRLPYQEGGLISLFHEYGQVEKIEHQRGLVVIQGRLPGRFLAQFQAYSKSNAKNEPDTQPLEGYGEPDPSQ